MSGIKIAPTGSNVFTTADKDLAFSSEFNVLKIIKEGIEDVDYTASSGSVTVTVAHGLNFTPQHLVYIDNLSDEFFMQGQDPDNNTDGNFISVQSWADATNLNIKVQVSSFSSLYASNATFPVKYFIFGDTTREASTQTPFPTPLVTTGFKVSKPGKSINSLYIEDYVIHSQMPSMKVHTKTTASDVGGGLTTIAHGLSFVPAFILMVSTNNSTFYLAPYNPSIGGDSAYAWADATNIYIRSFNVPAATHYFKLIIFANRIDL